MRNVQNLFKLIFFAVVIYFFISVAFSDIKLESYSEKDEENDNRACGKFPQERDIFVDNVIWQVLQTPRGFLKLLNAYLDTRFNKRIVRVNVSSYVLNKKSDLIFCQFWFDDQSGPYVVRATGFILMWPNGLNF